MAKQSKTKGKAKAKSKAKPAISHEEALAEFVELVKPVETKEQLILLTDNRTGARYCECHLKASALIKHGTTKVPIDPANQADYPANREIVASAKAFATMKEDAKKKRSFSNIVTEYMKQVTPDRPIKIIGGQHRFEAIKEALDDGIDESHGIKVYLNLSKEQRVDVQYISNTNIAVSRDLYDRMQETFLGPEMRDWCQKVGFLEANEDFADRRERGGPIPVQLVRSFIMNYYAGKSVPFDEFSKVDTTPLLCVTGEPDPDWEKVKGKHKDLWEDEKLAEAAKEYAALIAAQREAFKKVKTNPKKKGAKTKVRADFPEKAMNSAVLTAWAYVAGTLEGNPTRLARHFALKEAVGKDPLNASALADGRHKSDKPNYRGLGYRTDAKERGRLVELFYNQAEDGKGITNKAVETAIAQHVVKQGQLELNKLKKES